MRSPFPVIPARPARRREDGGRRYESPVAAVTRQRAEAEHGAWILRGGVGSRKDFRRPHAGRMPSSGGVTGGGGSIGPFVAGGVSGLFGGPAAAFFPFLAGSPPAPASWRICPPRSARRRSNSSRLSCPSS